MAHFYQHVKKSTGIENKDAKLKGIPRSSGKDLITMMDREVKGGTRKTYEGVLYLMSYLYQC